MKTFFRQEHLDLDKVTALAKAESSMNHTKILNQQQKLIEDMETRMKANLVDALTDFASAYEDEKPTECNKHTNSDLASALLTINGNSN